MLPEKQVLQIEREFQKMFSFFQLFGKFDPLTNQTEIRECNLLKKTLKIKISCLIYADILLRFNRNLSFFFKEREWFKDYIFPSSFTWAWDQQDLTAKQVNPGGVA